VGETLHCTGARVGGIADGGALGDDLLQLPGLGPGLFLGAALGEDPLAGHRVVGNHPVAGLAGGGGVDAGAVLELGERLLAIPTGHDRRPPRGTQRYGLLRMAAVGNFVPESCARQREHARHTFYHKAKLARRDPDTVSLPS
jgi:hypothetical protein